jgi:ubiquinone/menaquinone biosynthesis C-methylase UbiE
MSIYPKFIRTSLYYRKLLKLINADSLEIIYPKNVSSNLENSDFTSNVKKKYFDYIHCNPDSTQDMYGKNDLAKFPMFSGGYINFGFWKGINYKKEQITEEQRIQSSINLYQNIFERLVLNHTSKVLEVGSGQGNGCVLLLNQFPIKKIIGLDAVPQQTERSISKHATFLKENPNVEFFTGLAEAIPFLNNSFSHLISIEAASHFSSVKTFFCEASRVLEPNGSLLVASVFPKNKESLDKLKDLLPKYHVYMNDFTIDKTPEYTNNFHNVKITSIGDNVWEGLDEWLKREELKHSWSRLWLKAYQAGLLDYYVIEANTLSKEEELKNQNFEKLQISQRRL